MATPDKPVGREHALVNPKIQVKKLDELTPRQAWNILALRFNVFVKEQQSIYDEFDGADLDAIHIFIEDNGKIVAYARVFRKTDGAAAFGRVAVDKDYRGQNLGRKIVEKAIEVAEKFDRTTKIQIEAQEYLQDFYTGFGFQPTSAPFDDAGVMHVEMEKAVEKM